MRFPIERWLRRQWVGASAFLLVASIAGGAAMVVIAAPVWAVLACAVAAVACGWMLVRVPQIGVRYTGDQLTVIGGDVVAANRTSPDRQRRP